MSLSPLGLTCGSLSLASYSYFREIPVQFADATHFRREQVSYFKPVDAIRYQSS